MTKATEKCPFCEIIFRDDLDVREVYRDEYTVAFFPTDPATLGHTLVVPRRHVADIWDIKQDEAAHIARTAVLVAHAIKEAIKPQGLNIIQSNGVAATQTIFHFHTHVVPRWADDGIGSIWPPEKNYSEKQKDQSWEKIKTTLKRICSK